MDDHTGRKVLGFVGALAAALVTAYLTFGGVVPWMTGQLVPAGTDGIVDTVLGLVVGLVVGTLLAVPLALAAGTGAALLVWRLVVPRS